MSLCAAVTVATGSVPGEGAAARSWLLILLLTPCWDSPAPSPQVLESCMKSCGKRFHDEVGKFRFLNELIKVVSPKVGLGIMLEETGNWWQEGFGKKWWLSKKVRYPLGCGQNRTVLVGDLVLVSR